MHRYLAGDRPCPSVPSFPACSPLFLRAGCRRNRLSIVRPCSPDQTSSYQIQPSSISARVRRVLFPARHFQCSVRSSPELEQATPYTTAHTKPLPKYISCDISPWSKSIPSQATPNKLRVMSFAITGAVTGPLNKNIRLCRSTDFRTTGVPGHQEKILAAYFLNAG